MAKRSVASREESRAQTTPTRVPTNHDGIVSANAEPGRRRAAGDRHPRRRVALRRHSHAKTYRVAAQQVRSGTRYEFASQANEAVTNRGGQLCCPGMVDRLLSSGGRLRRTGGRGQGLVWTTARGSPGKSPMPNASHGHHHQRASLLAAAAPPQAPQTEGMRA